MFGALKRAMGAGAREVKAEYGENKDFLEAVCAAAALVAAADGDIEESERRPPAASCWRGNWTTSRAARTAARWPRTPT